MQNTKILQIQNCKAHSSNNSVILDPQLTKKNKSSSFGSRKSPSYIVVLLDFLTKHHIKKTAIPTAPSLACIHDAAVLKFDWKHEEEPNAYKCFTFFSSLQVMYKTPHKLPTKTVTLKVTQ